ncbi:ABC transporter ATP-binding protein Uup [Legionella santicrucis]|uniref:ABC transporter ATP-binding protein Uup n=1 Tax=Legionella santicrucis TaxID=45074 RepID=A0A0W0Y9F2_9GAMM|nr:ATP-binding cassette domain-containing protein [Legionella santicrucis]KTD53466.1 ABC transporter ATP-binding protein Uup [Legionella santicrucis]
MHKPIQLIDFSLFFPHKTCFSDFNSHILYGSRIAIIGRNGEGKSTLLKILQGTYTHYDGTLILPNDLRIGYLPQLIENDSSFSGGERLNRALTKSLSLDPNLLLLDEPTNHLDNKNRRALIKHLQYYTGTLIMVTHDVEVLKTIADTIWHIQHGMVHVFHGNYDDYQREIAAKTLKIEHELANLKQQKREAHEALMKEQERGKRMKINGEKNIHKRKWPTVRSHTKLANAVKTGDKRIQHIENQKQNLLDDLSMLYRHEVIQPQFQLNACTQIKASVSINHGTIRYAHGAVIIKDIHFHLSPKARVAICGDNGSGKSTFIKALLEDKDVIKTGDWTTPRRSNIGYLDQHYQNLPYDQTVLQLVTACMPNTTYTDIRKHLNTFLFRKNEEVDASISNLSGGEKARLSLCAIAANPPALLILDEMTNNLDLETRTHVIHILRAYPGAILIISHDNDFLKAISIETTYSIEQGTLVLATGDHHHV